MDEHDRASMTGAQISRRCCAWSKLTPWGWCATGASSHRLDTCKVAAVAWDVLLSDSARGVRVARQEEG
eukprot:scaffold15378_cov29-Phaeocystis_antarctica.AAC.1